MDKKDLVKYIGKKIFIVLKNRYKYKFVLQKNNIKETTLSFLDIYNNPIDLEISEIAIITISSDKECENDELK